MPPGHLPPSGSWTYALACITVPVAWGLAMVWVSNGVERLLFRRRPRTAETAREAPLEYHL